MRWLQQSDIAQREQRQRTDQDVLLAVMRQQPHGTLREWAECLEWRAGTLRTPDHKRVTRTLERLRARGWVRKYGDHYALTATGKEQRTEPRADPPNDA